VNSFLIEGYDVRHAFHLTDTIADLPQESCKGGSRGWEACDDEDDPLFHHSRYD